jgi:hypothetical protein
MSTVKVMSNNQDSDDIGNGLLESVIKAAKKSAKIAGKITVITFLAAATLALAMGLIDQAVLNAILDLNPEELLKAASNSWETYYSNLNNTGTGNTHAALTNISRG